VQRLNFGCATDIREGWVNLDRDRCGQEIVADLLSGLPFNRDTFDCIVANHSINSIRFDDLGRAFTELQRVLKPGGTLRILVPNADWAYANADLLPVSEELEPTKDGRVLRYLFWHGDSRCAFTATSLLHTVIRSGFSTAHRVRYGATESMIRSIVELDSRELESLIVEAVK
jgi:SAM-dependent methyltransferase